MFARARRWLHGSLISTQSRPWMDQEIPIFQRRQLVASRLPIRRRALVSLYSGVWMTESNALFLYARSLGGASIAWWHGSGSDVRWEIGASPFVPGGFGDASKHRRCQVEDILLHGSKASFTAGVRRHAHFVSQCEFGGPHRSVLAEHRRALKTGRCLFPGVQR